MLSSQENMKIVEACLQLINIVLPGAAFRHTSCPWLDEAPTYQLVEDFFFFCLVGVYLLLSSSSLASFSMSNLDDWQPAEW